MNAALRRLLWLETRGQLRQLGRRMRTLRGAMMALGMGLFFTLLVVATTVSVDAQAQLSVGAQGLRRFGPLGLFGLMLLGAFSPRGLYFKPPEVALLFPAPVLRRDLVLFNVLSRAKLALLSALWLAAFPSLRGRSFVATLLGYSLCLVLIQVSAQWFAVARLWLGARRPVRVGLIVAVGAAVGSVVVTANPSLLSPLLWLTRPFIEVLAAEAALEGLAWSVPSLLLLALLVASLCAMDVAYLEAALGRSRKAQTQRSRMRSGGGALATATPSRRLRVPHFPYLHGAGPLAWRQCMEAVRNPRGALLVLFVVMMGASVVLLFPALPTDAPELPPILLPSISLAMVFAASLLIGDNLAFDFRRDLDRMPLLKSLPISPLAIASGQVAAATLFVTAIQLVGVTIVVTTSGVFSPTTVAWLLPVLPLANWSALAIENVLFLLMPYRTIAEDPGDVAFVGRLMLSMILKLVTISLIAGSGVGFGLLVRAVSGSSFAIGALATCIWLAVACVPLTFGVAHAFQRFDVARDIPA